ncbi:amylo-alpha-1,6-glucosidase [Calothrix sp. 336/3]|uniref:amylo-alpha-1,6-glucosidase n=1 Tax=Calothrix sp. 336/3 TaxID=1337936 RepID=UPI0004E34322|nr:amylo-alpha-1,6-glucosidase [Calothrix sp. 336/3]AKG23135.1 amylo-alpha-1,6-glucosidase [Calothrix sp. 336/3]
MVDLDTREWLLTNGLGSFASGTVTDIRTRTYHGWFFAAASPPSGRTLLLSHLEASLELADKVIALGANFWCSGEIVPQGYKYLRSFQIHPVPKWTWGEEDWQLTRQLVMPHGENRNSASGDSQNFSQSLLMHYRYQGDSAAVLRLRLLIGDRSLHNQQQQMSELQFSQILGNREVSLQAIHKGHFGTPWHLSWTEGDYQPDAFWYWNYQLPEETNRGLGDREDLYSPGYLTVYLEPGDTVTLEAKIGFPEKSQISLTDDTFSEAVEAEQERLGKIFPGGKVGNNLPSANADTYQQLLQASDQFIVHRAAIDSPIVIAGYHWFNSWGRHTLIALPGLALSSQRYDLAKALLRTIGGYSRYGLMPNSFPELGSEPTYNSIDAALWWIEILGLYLEVTQDWAFLAEQYPLVQQIYKAFMGGTRFNIQVDSTDGLVGWYARGLALTWMDAVVDGQPVTPRQGKTVEINALWYSALCWASRWAEILMETGAIDETNRLAKQGRRYIQQAEQVKASLQKFWNPQLGYLYDTIDPEDHRNSQIRPNAVLALSLSHCAFSASQGQKILQLAASRLLTPYGLRSLDPADPEYLGQYVGNSTSRDRAYHQGTVWCWLIGPFIRAWQRFYPTEPLPFDWQPLIQHFAADACIGSISEIFDGDEPHTPRGAIAQAWSVAEVIRHWDNR